ncbi:MULTISPECIES: response regulator transcription factor [unclassified Pseudoalteromonas]|uniref:response regulator transcription factor n=1 Tax=unclassified Pseudoalteromonas TaxID=194690 RepID=UPI000CF5E133|nr:MULTISPECIES: response regulator [unclassified Pseudoalteromonas]
MSGSETQSVYVVDDDPVVLDAIAELLQSVELNTHTYASAQQFFDAYNDDMSGCLLLDIRMPEMNGMELQKRLSDINAKLPIIFISGHADVSLAVRAMREGAFDLIEKPFRDNDLLECIYGALKKDKEARAGQAGQAEIKERLATLTNREREIYDLVVAGKANKVMAIELGVSQRTVEIHRARVFKKMAVRSLAELVRMNTLLDS